MLSKHSHGLSRWTQIIQKYCHCNSEMFNSVCTLPLISLHQSIIQTDSFSPSPALVSNSSQQKRKKKSCDENKHFLSGSTWSKKNINHSHFLFFTWEFYLYILIELNVAAGNVWCEPWMWCSTHDCTATNQKSFILFTATLMLWHIVTPL